MEKTTKLNTKEDTGAKKASARGNDERGSRGDRGGDREEKGGSWRRRERPPLDLIVDYKDIETLRPFISEGGRIVPSRVSRLNRKQQRILQAEVKRARQLALLPVSDRHTVIR
jgi:small subunit ribosomal protein S18